MGFLMIAGTCLLGPCKDYSVLGSIWSPILGISTGQVLQPAGSSTASSPRHCWPLRCQEQGLVP